MAVVLVTATQSAGQYTVLAYAAPYYKNGFGATPGADQLAVCLVWHLGAGG
jgi:DHA1 family inner membrane transport protein